MIGAFRFEGGAYRAQLEPPYSTLITQLAHEILIVLDEPTDLGVFVQAATQLETGRAAPQERALGHLLPAMSLDTDDASGLRALTEDFLRSEKSSRLRLLSSQIERAQRHGALSIEILPEDVWEWLAALNDLRLGLAGELGLDTVDDVTRIEALACADPNGTREQAAAAIYELLTWWQDSLITALNISGASN